MPLIFREMTVRQERWLLFFIALFFIITTRDIYTVDTGDYFRVLSPLVTEDYETVRKNTYTGLLTYHFRDSFLSIEEALGGYPSSYSLITYLLAGIAKLITSVLDLRLVAIAWKTAFFISAVLLFKKVTGVPRFSLLSGLLFLLASLVLVSSSNIAFLNSFYAEQAALVALMWIVYYFADTGEKKTAGYALLLSCLIFSTAKTQYFYIPGFIAALVLFRRKAGPSSRFHLAGALCIIQVVAILCVNASNLTDINKYHTAYFGSYLWLKNNNRDVSNIPNKECIGIDTWGNRFDMKEGAVSTDLKSSCYELNRQASYADTLSVLKNNPDFIYRLITDQAIQEQLYSDYFHVFKSTKVFADEKQRQGFYARLTFLKDRLFRTVKLPAMLLLFLFSGLLLKVDRKWALIMLALSGVAVSQFYISFIGDGYRDFSKHVLLLHYSFDLILFCLIAVIGGKIMARRNFRPPAPR